MSGRWVKVLLGPLPATVFFLPLLFAGGVGAAIALIAVLRDPAFSTLERWNSVLSTTVLLIWIAAAGVGVLALWRVLTERPAALREGPHRWWLAFRTGRRFDCGGQLDLQRGRWQT